MKVAENTMVSFDGRNDAVDGRSGGIGFTPPEMMEGKDEHDARGLLIALMICAACWALLGCFLLV